MEHLTSIVMSFLTTVVEMGSPDSYVLAKSNYMPVDRLETVRPHETLIVMPRSSLEQLLANVRDKA